MPCTRAAPVLPVALSANCIDLPTQSHSPNPPSFLRTTDINKDVIELLDSAAHAVVVATNPLPFSGEESQWRFQSSRVRTQTASPKWRPAQPRRRLPTPDMATRFTPAAQTTSLSNMAMMAPPPHLSPSKSSSNTSSPPSVPSPR